MNINNDELECQVEKHPDIERLKIESASVDRLLENNEKHILENKNENE